MKRKMPFILGFLLAAASAAFTDEMAEVYRQIYMESEGLSQKYSAVLNLVALEDRSVAPVLADALEDLLRTQPSYTALSDRELHGRAVLLVAKALGDFKYDESASMLWQVVVQVPDPLARSEAVIALGKMRALAYVERIALLLRDLNLKPASDRDSGERLAYGAIVSLDRLRDVRGFSPVFFAIDAWYTQRVRQQAERSLLNIVDDPTDAIKEILVNESVDRKVRALKAEMASRASVERKIETSIQALQLGHGKATNDKAESRVLADLRKLALGNLITLKAKASASIEGCLQSYGKGYDDQERLLGLAALGVNGGDVAAAALRDIILKLNADQRAGLIDETRNRMARAPAFSTAALVAVVTNERWSGGIILAAQNAVKAIP
jgi:hypothetical protein